MSGARKYAMHRSFILRNSLVLKNSVAVVGLPVGIGAGDGAVALFAIVPEPLKLRLVVGGQSAPAHTIFLPGSACGRPYAPELGFVAFVIANRTHEMMYMVAVKSASV